MSLRDDRDFKNHFLSAKERDLESLMREGVESLDLEGAQIEGMETFLTKAWFSGTHAFHAQMLTRVMERNPEFGPLDVELLEADLKELMDESADTLNLTVTNTVNMWGILGRACIAGIQTCRAEIAAALVEANSDVSEEALRWLEQRGGSEEGD